MARGAARLALIAALVWVGRDTARSFGDLLSGPRLAPRPARVDADREAGPSDLLSRLARGGPWTLAGLPCRLEIRRLRPEEVESRMVAPAAPSSVAAAADPGAELMALVRSALRPARRDDAGTLYALDRPGLKATARIGRDGGRDRLLVGRLAFPDDEGGWTLIEATPTAPESPDGRARPGILPLPEGVAPLAARGDENGAPLAQVVVVAAPPGVLLETWRRLGWDVEPLDGAGGGATPVLRCRRGGESVLAWAVPAGDDPGRLCLILVRDAAPRADLTRDATEAPP